MEDAHAAILDLRAAKDGPEDDVASENIISFFGVYDGHGGERVAQFSGENVHQIVTRQDAFKKKDFAQALKDGFLATDRALLTGRERFQASCLAHARSSTNWRFQIQSLRKKYLAALLPWESSRMTRSMWYGYMAF